MKKTCRYNIAGIRYGHLTAIEPTDRRDGTNIIWRFRCDCGRIVERTTKHLTDHSACEICRPRGFGLRKDYTGQRFGRLVALECTGEHKGKELVWRLQCDCGNIVELSVSRFVGGSAKSCGCLKKDVAKENNPNYEDLRGKAFGLVTVDEVVPSTSEKSCVRWLCKCACGNAVTATTTALNDGKVRSCGCVDARRYCVYKLVSPDGKVYIGTIGIVPRRRWFVVQAYNSQAALLQGIEKAGGEEAFRTAFRRYYFTQDKGWIEYTKPVPFEETNRYSVKEAEKLKRTFIKEYQATNPQYGYNAATGSRKDFSYTEEARRRQSQTRTGEDGRTDWKVYVHTNKINGKKYVGVTCRDLKIRWAKGKGYKRPKDQGEALSHFYHSIQKYGWDNFEHEIVKDGLTKAEAAEEEKRLIALYDTTNPEKGYNVTLGGDGSSGAKHSDGTRKLLSRLTKERFAQNPESNPFKGKHHTEETKEKLRQSHKRMYDGEKNPFAGKHHTEKTKALLSEQHSQPVNQYSLQGEYIQQFRSGREAAAAVGTTPTSIADAANGKTRFSAGYIWKKAAEAPPVGAPIDAASVLGTSKHCGQKKQVDQYSLDGQFIKRYSSLAEAAEAVGTAITNLSAAAWGKHKTCKGYIWKFAEKT